MSPTLRKRLERLEQKLNPPFNGVLFVPSGSDPDETEILIQQACSEKHADRARVPIIVYTELDLAI